jgi:hypothetical protein
VARPKGNRRKEPGGKVVVAYLHPGTVAAGFHTSLLNLYLWDNRHQRRILDGGGHLAMQSGANITKARNDVARQFLDQHDAEWLLWIDSDMTFDPDSLDRLLEAADPVERPIVGGLCFGQTTTGRWDEVWPTIYWWDDSAGYPAVARATDYPPDTLIKVGSTGSAFILIHRQVLEDLREKFPEPFPWYQESGLGGRHVSEDHTFCLRAVASGFPIHIHTGIRTGHVKQHELDEGAFRRYQVSLRPPEVVVTGTGRSGTGFLTEVLREVCVNAGHEAWFNPFRKMAPDLQVDVSWMALPMLSGRERFVGFQLRDPLKVLSSLANGDLETPDGVAYLRFAQEHTPGWDDTDPLLHNLVRFLTHWWEKGVGAADQVWEVEELSPDTIVHLALEAGVEVSWEDAEAAIAGVPASTNKHRPGPKLAWADLPELPETERLRGLASDWGYL